MRTRHRDFRAVIRAVSLACRNSQIIIPMPRQHSKITCAVKVDKRKSMMSTMVARMVNRRKRQPKRSFSRTVWRRIEVDNTSGCPARPGWPFLTLRPIVTLLGSSQTSCVSRLFLIDSDHNNKNDFPSQRQCRHSKISNQFHKTSLSKCEHS